MDFVVLNNLQIKTYDESEFDLDEIETIEEQIEYNQDGWRLPSIEELKILFINKDLIGGFKDDYYWSSTVEEGFNFSIDFKDGFPTDVYEGPCAYVRLVKNIL
jgi:hypothetical protein